MLFKYNCRLFLFRNVLSWQNVSFFSLLNTYNFMFLSCRRVLIEHLQFYVFHLQESAQEEFGGVVESFLTTGEELFGPYVWGRYDILVMPPSFPFGGMENPCLTFVTPCLLVGDKSMTDVVIHEIVSFIWLFLWWFAETYAASFVPLSIMQAFNAQFIEHGLCGGA